MSPKDYLDVLLKSERVPHALLFCGPKGSDKREAAFEFASALLKSEKSLVNHPDLHELFIEGKSGMHPISSMRKMAEDAALLPYEAPVKVFIIHEAERMLPTSSNALLKTLEEPPTRTIIILLSDYPGKLLPTILSRCLKIEFHSNKKNIDEDLLAILVEGASADKLQGFESKDPDALFETLLFWFRDRQLIELGAEKYLHFPEHISALKKFPYIALEEVEKKVIQMRLAFERSTKLSTCLEIFFLSI